MAKNRKSEHREKLMQVAKRETKALFAAAAIFAGVSIFLWIVQSSWEAMPADWWRLALAVTFMTLPEAFAKLKDADDPYVILFALAFRDGFLYLPVIGPDLAKWVTKTRKLWKIITRK